MTARQSRAAGRRHSWRFATPGLVRKSVASQMACFLRSHHHMRQEASLASMSRNRVDAGTHPVTALRRFLTESVLRLFSLPDDAKQALRMRRYFAAAGTSLLALRL